MSDSFVRIPPDSTGKRIKHNVLLELFYDSGTIDFVVGEPIIGATSGIFGNIVFVNGTTISGELHIALNEESIDTAVDNENLQIEGVTHAAANGVGIPIYIPASQIVGSNPLYKARIDNKGALFVRFTEGVQQLDAFGLSRQSTPYQLAEYIHTYDELPNEWQDTITGASTLTHLPDESSWALDINTASGDKFYRTTHRYHIYQAGYSQLVEMTVVCGDSGKADVRRRWGYFDANNGVFFEHDGINLYVVLRSSVSGSVVDSRTLQSSWSGDHLDGSGDAQNLSKMDFDLSKLNLFWFDIQWLGAGAVRFGVYSPSGGRIVCHSIGNPNTNTGVYMTIATLPIRVEIENTAVSGSPSRIKLACASVKIEGILTPELSRRSVKWDSAKAIVTTTAEKPILSFRSRLTINSVRNSKTTIGEKISAYIKTQPCRIRIYMGGTLTGPSWSSIRTDAAVEQDTSSSAFSGGSELISWVVDPGCRDIDLPDNFGLLGIALRLKADNSQDFIFIVTVESLEATDTTIEMSITGIDIG